VRRDRALCDTPAVAATLTSTPAIERYEAVIGMEVHAQLKTASKMFCGCSTAYDGAAPNTHCCPVCLGLLSNPARVGHPSRSFLAWHGTELICGKGHGLLHVPEMATSWFSTQRWLALDGSWRALFPNLAQR